MIAILILNYNTYKETKELILKLQDQTLKDELCAIIVDNCSPNNSFKELKPLEKQYNNVTVIQTTENLGYAKGNNFGLKYLDEHFHPEYVAILNNDVELPNDCFEKLILKYEELEDSAIIAPKQLDLNGKALRPYRVNSYLDDCLNMFYIFKIFHARNAMNYEDNTGKRAMKVEMVPGSFMFASFEKFKLLGFFYPGTFLFAEERFIAAEVRKRKLQNYILLDETYIHAHSKTINTIHSQVSKYKLLYESWMEYTRVCRSNGKAKAAILRPLMKYSLFEMKVVHAIRSLFL